MRTRMNISSALATILTVVGAVNWGLVALFNFNLVRVLTGRFWIVRRAVYAMVGLAGLWLTVSLLVPALFRKMGPSREEVTVVAAGRSIVGTKFPHIQGRTLEGRRIALPRDIKGRVALLAVGFSYESRWDVQDWVDAFRHRFEDRPGFTYYEIPVIAGLSQLAAPAIEQGMRAGTPSSMHGRVMSVYGPSESIRKALGASHTVDSWFYLVDDEGIVLYQVGGRFDPEQFENLSAKASSAEAATRPRVERRAA